ncbi:hypothetical protein NW762_012141 [Fusarium torreyae]|uniref:6-phosphogluconate dehydrogenase NADP-binding domain-containing protein n=1 Tax=Fusarium torreyae TaxID=1237075 RepID=A0A9W8V921_9HYPO|nr:hypothetical protein NW762_012141 [Fusarium torreyae]
MSANQVGFAGLGAMGFGMASNLVKAGFSVHSFDISPIALKSFNELGGSASRPLREASDGQNKSFVMVATPEQVDAIVFGREGLASALLRLAILCLFSTLPPQLEHIGRSHIRLVDFPVSEGVVTIMLGGENDTIDEIQPELEAISAPGRLFRVGPVGAASKVKMLNQHLAGTHIHWNEPQLGLDANASWHEAPNWPSNKETGYLGRLFASLSKEQVNSLKPARQFLSSPEKSTQHILSFEADRYVADMITKGQYRVYSGWGDVFTVDLDDVPRVWGHRGASVTARWFNPRKGVLEAHDLAETFQAKGRKTFTPPSSGVLKAFKKSPKSLVEPTENDTNHTNSASPDAPAGVERLDKDTVGTFSGFDTWLASFQPADQALGELQVKEPVELPTKANQATELSIDQESVELPVKNMMHYPETYPERYIQGQ